jgi:hypothetical protein
MTKGKREELQTHGSLIGRGGDDNGEYDGWVDSGEINGVDCSDLPCTGNTVKRLPYNSCCKPIRSIRVNITRASCRCLSTSSNRHLEVSHKC